MPKTSQANRREICPRQPQLTAESYARDLPHWPPRHPRITRNRVISELARHNWSNSLRVTTEPKIRVTSDPPSINNPACFPQGKLTGSYRKTCDRLVQQTIAETYKESNSLIETKQFSFKLNQTHTSVATSPSQLMLGAVVFSAGVPVRFLALLHCYVLSC